MSLYSDLSTWEAEAKGEGKFKVTQSMELSQDCIARICVKYQ